MKTSFKAKIIIESKRFTKPDGSILDGNQISMQKIIDSLNKGVHKIEAVDDFLTNNSEPTLIIKI